MLIETPAIWYQKMPCKPVLKKTVHNKAQSFRKLSVKKKPISRNWSSFQHTDPENSKNLVRSPVSFFYTIFHISLDFWCPSTFDTANSVFTWGIDQYWFLCVKLLLLIKMENQGILVFITPIYRTVIKPCC